MKKLNNKKGLKKFANPETYKALEQTQSQGIGF